jgi:hypothetical protein
MLSVAFENGVIELRDQLLAGPIPELEDRRHQAHAGHVVIEPVLAQQIERRRMRGRGARLGLQRAIVVEQPHRKAAAAKQPSAKEADRSAAGDQDSALVVGHCGGD